MVCLNNHIEHQTSNIENSISGGNGVPVKHPAPGFVGLDLHERPAAVSLQETFMRPGSHEISVQATEARSVDSGANSGRATNRKKKPNRGRNPRFVVQETTGISDRNLELPISAAEMDMAYRNFWIRRGFSDHEIPSASTWYLAPEPQEGPILTNYFGKDVYR